MKFLCPFSLGKCSYVGVDFYKVSHHNRNLSGKYNKSRETFFWSENVWKIPGENMSELANSQFVGLVGRFYNDNSHR